MAVEPGDAVDEQIEADGVQPHRSALPRGMRAVSQPPGDGTTTTAAHRSADEGGRLPGPGAAIDPAWAERVRASYDEVRAPLWRVLVAWSASPDVADEALAEAFAQLLRRGPEVRDPSAWAWRTAFRLAAGDLQRRRAAAGPGDATLALLPAAADRLPDDALDLVRALAQLSDQQRRCVALVDVAGHTAPSAAAVLDTSAATVRVQLMRARRRLRVLLADPASPEETS